MVDQSARENEMLQAIAASPRIVDLLARGALRSPARAGLIYLRHPLDPEPVVYSFDAYMGLVKAAENWFRAQGIGAGDAVAILTPTSPATIVSMWAASACGVADPLNLLFSREALIAQLNAIEAKLLIVPPKGTPGGLYEKVEGLISDVPSLKRIIVALLDGSVTFDGETLQPDASWRDDYGRCANAAEADRVAVYLPTGGTTGAPKIAKLTNRNVVASCIASQMAFDVREGDCYLVALPLFHVGGMCVGSGAAGSIGATLVYPGPAGARDPAFVANFWKLVERFRVTHGGHVPTGLGAIADVPINGADISSLRVVPTGGSICPPEIERRFLARWGGKEVVQVYGQTETAGGITHDWHPRPNRAERVGTANPGTELAIVKDGIYHRGPNTPAGELVARGPQIFKGYVSDEQTKSALREGWLYTGDIARIDEDGYVEIMGRVKDLIIRSGHNIDPRAIEDAAMEYPGVALAAAIGKPDAYAGEVPALYVSAQPGATLDMDALQAFVQEKIFEAPARPKRVALIAEMPVTAVGKIFKPKLREWATSEAAREALAAAGLADRAQAEAVTDPERGLILQARARAEDVEAVRAALGAFPVKLVVEAR